MAGMLSVLILESYTNKRSLFEHAAARVSSKDLNIGNDLIGEESVETLAKI